MTLNRKKDSPSLYSDYIVKDSGSDLVAALMANNYNCRIAFHHELEKHLWQSAVDSGKVVAHTIDVNKSFMERILGMGYHFCTGRDLHAEDPTPRTAHLRHDVDGDLIGAVMCAEMLTHLEIPASFYVLHTAPYYGQWVEEDGEKVFIRRGPWTGL